MTDPVEVLLRFAFIGVLYLFLLWVARSALKDLRAGRGESVREGEAAPAPPPRGILVAEKGAGLGSGTAYEVDGTSRTRFVSATRSSGTNSVNRPSTDREGVRAGWA
jgi:hypothetical protein